MNFARIKQLYNRRDRLQEMIESQNEQILSAAKNQRELERKAYEDVFGPKPERDPKNAYGDLWTWESNRVKRAQHLGNRYLKLTDEPFQIEAWSSGCRGGYDELEGAFTLDERILTDQDGLYADFVAKYQKMATELDRKRRTDLMARRVLLEIELQQINGASK